MRMNRISSIIGLVLLMIPAATSAQSTDAHIQALIQQIQVLQDRLAALQQTATHTASPAVAASCVRLTHSFGVNDVDARKGGEVSKLQRFLADGGYYTGVVTGRVGPLTVEAIKKWQRANGIASSGTAATTGYGYIGPKSRAKLAAQCASASDNLIRWDSDLATDSIAHFSLKVGQTARTDDGDRDYLDIALSATSPEITTQFRVAIASVLQIDRSEQFVSGVERMVTIALPEFDQDEVIDLFITATNRGEYVDFAIRGEERRTDTIATSTMWSVPQKEQLVSGAKAVYESQEYKDAALLVSLIRAYSGTDIPKARAFAEAWIRYENVVTQINERGTQMSDSELQTHGSAYVLLSLSLWRTASDLPDVELTILRSLAKGTSALNALPASL